MRRWTWAFILGSKIIPNRLQWDPQMFYFFWEICEVNLSCYFCFISETEVGCVEKLRHLYLFPGLLYSPQSHMINVLKITCGLLAEILTQPMAPPRGHHRNGQERCPRQKMLTCHKNFWVACPFCDAIVEIFDYLIGVVAYISFWLISQVTMEYWDL